ncbi:hypothetical protein FPV67DRAFT_614174 [Lyophyllum atratum]|nr:hypothetical protein FPV67DRAFT_614174 [Lyophyllum atratum]
MRSVPREGEHEANNQTPPSSRPMAFPPPQFQPEGTPTHATLSVSSSSPLFEEDIDKESLSSLSSLEEVAVSLSSAEKAREKKLRDDPMAIVIGPLYVDCRQCGTRIKLSTKSLYDGCHWRTHRSRCLRRRSAAPKKQTPKAQILASPKPSQVPKERRTPPVSGHKEATPECEVLLRSPPPTPPYSTPPRPVPRTPDAIFSEYVLRSHGKKHIPPTLTHWQDWSWSQLLLPRFVGAPDLNTYDNNDDDDSYMNDADSRPNDSVTTAVF